jgi:hypothetical protein
MGSTAAAIDLKKMKRNAFPFAVAARWLRLEAGQVTAWGSP